MATVQPLRGDSHKIFSISANFSRGIDRKTADDVSSDQTFTELVNFYNAAEGYLSKRPGAYNSHISDFIKALATDDYDETKFVIQTNRFGETDTTIKARIVDLYNTVFAGIKKTGSSYEGTQFTFQADKVVGFQLLKNDFFLDAMQNYEDLLNGVVSEDSKSKIISFSCILVVGGFYTSITNSVESAKQPGLYIGRFYIKIEYDEANERYNANIELDTVDSTMNPFKNISNNYVCRWDYMPDGYTAGLEETNPSNTVDLSNYNGYTYIATGTNYIVKINQNPDVKTVDSDHADESNIIAKIGGYEGENLYKPTAIELNQVGFNILAADPLTYYDRTGAVSKTKGVFFSVTTTKDGVSFQQPVTSVPYNAPFYLHIIYTGNTAPTEIKYRPNNGEVDTTKNPYINLPGAWLAGSNNTIWACTGVDSDQNFELYIKLGTDEFRTYFTTTSGQKEETGYINEISKLVFSSTHSKIINNQLVLYGGHGYLFFSEYDMFNYFPNYYYIYVASEAGEEAVTGLVYFRQYYAIFTNKRIKRMSGAFGTDTFGIYPLSDFIGCPNGRTIRSVGNNLIFLGNDGLYRLKQGYIGEGTENVEKVDEIIDGDLNLNNVLQAFVMNNNYVAIKNDGKTWVVYNTTTDAFYEYNLESAIGIVYDGRTPYKEIMNKTLPFYTIFQPGLYDAYGDFLIVPMYNYDYASDYESFTRAGMDIMLFRFSDLDFLDEDLKHVDGDGFISSLETHFMNMGYPMHTKKFKELFIKMINTSGYAIPIYVTITIDDIVVISPKDYIVYYNEENDTFYYIEKIENNATIDTAKALGEFKLGYDKLGNKTIQQIRFKIRRKGRAIKVRISDGYNDYTNLLTEEIEPVKGFPERKRNDYNFSISSMGIVYKLKKVKEG